MALWEQTKDLTDITVESGRAVGRSLQRRVTAVVSGWAVGWLPEICASLVGGGWTAGHGAALISAFWSRTKAWAGGEAAVQGNALQSRRAHTPKSWGRWPLSLALRASVVSLSVALKGAGHTTSPRHLVVCLGSWAPWRLLGRQALEHTFPITLRLSLHPRTDPRRGQGPPFLPEAWACPGSLRNSP